MEPEKKLFSLAKEIINEGFLNLYIFFFITGKL